VFQKIFKLDQFQGEFSLKKSSSGAVSSKKLWRWSRIKGQFYFF